MAKLISLFTISQQYKIDRCPRK